MRISLAVAALGVTTFCAGAALAQSYPSKLIRVIVPIAIGGPPDVAARAVTTKMSEGLGQSLVVENRSGAGGTIGAIAAARAPADGYNLFVGSVTSLAIGPYMFPKAGVDPVKQFAPISLFTIAPSVIVIAASLPANTLKEFIDLVRQKPGHYNFGAPTLQSPPAISAAQFMNAAGLKMTGVPFTNPAGVLQAIVNGDAHLFIEPPGSMAGYIRAGKVRALAVAHSKRHPLFPDLPTAAEAGLPGFESGTWSGMLTPAGTPQPIVRRLNAEVHKAVTSPEVTKLFLTQGGEPTPGTPEEFAKLIAAEVPKWARAMELAGVKPE